MVCCHKNSWHWHWHLCSQCFGIFLANLEYEIFYIFLQDNRVTDHRLKMNFELTGFLMGDIESAVQVNYIYKDANRATCNYYNKRKDEVHGTEIPPLMLVLLLLKHLQSCSSMEQKELLEEMATSVGAAKV